MFTLSISNGTKKDMALFDITEYPFTYDDLKKKYRAMLKQCHPDKVPEDQKKEAEKKTFKVIETFKKLKNISVGNIVREEVKTTGDIFEDKMISTCRVCKGSGTVETVARRVACKNCTNYNKGYELFYFAPIKGKGFVYEECGACKGTGKFIQKHTKKEVKCLRCSGYGRTRHRCQHCMGKGYINITENVKCSNCGGTGQIKCDPMNPVIPKGAVL